MTSSLHKKIWEIHVQLSLIHVSGHGEIWTINTQLSITALSLPLALSISGLPSKSEMLITEK
jgi:hypothetical protein